MSERKGTSQCPRCGSENADQNRFCIQCGAPLGGVGKVVPTSREDTWETEYLRLIREANGIATQVGLEVTAANQNFKNELSRVEKKLNDAVEQLREKENSIERAITEAEESFKSFADKVVTQANLEYPSDNPPDPKWAQEKLQELTRVAREYASGRGVLPLDPVVLTQNILGAYRSLRKAERRRRSIRPGEGFGRWGCLTTVLSLFMIGVAVDLFGEQSMLPLVAGIFTYAFVYYCAKGRVSRARNRVLQEVSRARQTVEQTIGSLRNAVAESLSQAKGQAASEAAASLQKAGERWANAVRETQEKARRALEEWRIRRKAFLDTIELWVRPWGLPNWASWEPRETPIPALRVGELRRAIAVDGSGISRVYQVKGAGPVPVPQVKPLREEMRLPLLVPFRGGKGLLFLCDSSSRDAAIRSIQALCFRLLVAVPAGKLRFTFMDPVGLGQNVATLINLKDYDASEEDSLVTFRVWTEADHIRQQLVALKDHITTVIQERLRDQYPDIETYNREAGEVAVPYRILVVLDFPANFNDEAAQHLLSIAQTGPRVGVYPIVLMDSGRKLPYDFKAEELVRSLVTVAWSEKERRWVCLERDFQPWDVQQDGPPSENLTEVLIRRWGEKAKEGMKVEVPFTKLLEAVGLRPDAWWQTSSRDGLQVPLGPITARKMQYLELGRGTLNHGLIVGRTGSGKSNLLHVLITASALKYPPDELRLYLIDLKTVEFTTYRDLPAAEAVAVDADREFALSVLEGLDLEMRHRMEAFKQVSANDLAEYRDKAQEKLPRILLIVDEFQVLFERQDRVADEAARLLDRLVRQGRAFGIHVLLGSQSLAGSALPRATIDQMGVRIALQCSEADSRLVLAEDNPAARRLSRPGQAIYNSRNGLIEGNSEFQIALFSDEDRESYVKRIVRKAEEIGWNRKPIVFEGNEPARLEACLPLLERMKTGPLGSVRVIETWIGESVSIRPPVAVRWSRRSGSHLVVVTREEEEGVGVLMAVALSLLVQYPANRLQVCIADFSTPDAEWAGLSEILQAGFPSSCRILGRRDLPTVLQEWQEMLQRSIDTGMPPQEDRYLFLVGLHRIRDLRREESVGYGFGEEREPAPSERLVTLLREGPEAGIHVVIWCDTVGNLRRSLERRALGEIGFRVGGAMSEQDSTELLDSPEAARLDKPHRMVFYDDERPGHPEKFRPYVIRNQDWLRSICMLSQNAEGGRSQVHSIECGGDEDG